MVNGLDPSCLYIPRHQDAKRGGRLETTSPCDSPQIECEAARVGLTRRRLSGTAEAWSVANELMPKAGVVPLNTPIISARKMKWRRGTYWGGTRKRAVLYPSAGGDSLTTLVHEIAHHIARANYGRAVQAHGEEFERAFKWRVSKMGGFEG